MKPNLFRELTTALLCGLILLQSATAVAPEWWQTHSVLNGSPADDYAVANVGQLKNLAKKAALEMNDSLPGGAGDAINTLIASWSAAPAAGVARDDYAAANLGQVKAVAQLFYDRLAAVGAHAPGPHPWGGVNADDHALANLGQLKTVFAFDIPLLDANGNGIPDTWEMLMFGNLDQDMDADFDFDGLSNREEFLAGTRADLADSDGDGWDDWTERAHGGDPNDGAKTPNASVLAIYGYATYDTDSLLADDWWMVAEHTDAEDPLNRWYAAHSWYYLGDTGWDSDHHASRPSTPLRPLPTDALNSDEHWRSEAVGWPFFADWYDANSLGPNSYVPNGAYLPIANHWDQSESAFGYNTQQLGWGVHWKRYRLRLHAPLSEDGEKTYLQVTYEWDKENAEWMPYDIWDIYSDGYWQYPEPTIKAVESVKMTIKKDQTVGDWLYVTPTTEDNKLLSVQLVELQFVSPAVVADSTTEMPSSVISGPLAAGGETAENGTGDPTISPDNLVFNDSQFQPVTELKIAKLAGAISDAGVLNSAPDPDQFMVRLSGFNRVLSGSLTIELETMDPLGEDAFPRDDNATEIPLYGCYDKPADLVNRKLLYYATPPMLLVAHPEDDIYKHGKKLNRPPNSPLFDPETFGEDNIAQAVPHPSEPVDRTHLAALGGKIRIRSVNYYETSPVLNQSLPAKTPHPVENVTTSVNSRKTVTVAVYVFSDSGALSGNDFLPQVWGNFQRARDLFAQAGVTLQLAEGFPKRVEPPKDGNGNSRGSNVEAHAPGQFGVPAEKGKILINACGSHNADVALVYCNDLTEGGISGPYGYAYPVSGGAGNHSNWAFVSGKSIGNSVVVFGHELGHLLTNAGHFRRDYAQGADDARKHNNLMKQGIGDGSPGIGNGCRLEQFQENWINNFRRR